jgi:hypothetical protein
LVNLVDLDLVGAENSLTKLLSVRLGPRLRFGYLEGIFVDEPSPSFCLLGMEDDSLEISLLLLKLMEFVLLYGSFTIRDVWCPRGSYKWIENAREISFEKCKVQK